MQFSEAVQSRTLIVRGGITLQSEGNAAMSSAMTPTFVDEGTAVVSGNGEQMTIVIGSQDMNEMKCPAKAIHFKK